MSLGPWEIFFIFLAILLLFGGKKIPEVARGLGKGLREFKKAKDEITESINDAIKEEPKQDKKMISEDVIDTKVKEEKESSKAEEHQKV